MGVDFVTAVLTYTLFLPLLMVSMPKAGMAWHNRQPADDEVLGGINWYYTYALHPYNEQAQFVPMLWCDRWPAYDYLNGYDYLAEARELYPANYTGYFLILNEPDLPGSDRDGGQCGMTPLQAAHFYRAAVTLWPDAKFVGPAVSHVDYWRGWEWLDEWYRLVDGMGLPLPHTAAVHTYLLEPPNLIIDSLLALLESHDAARQVWVTEFGSCSPQQAQTMIDYFQSDGRVTRYAWFTTRGGGCTDLVYEDVPGYSLTPLGMVWKNEYN